MSKYPVARVKRALPAVQSETVTEPGNLVPAEPSSWFSFSYSYTELSSIGGTAKVKRNRTRFEDGKIKSESFEGTLDSAAFDALARRMQDQMLRQTQMLMSPLLWFLPHREKIARDDE
jgi:hypothetical protein